MKFEISGTFRALTIATLAFAANFSVWTLYAVLGLELQDALNLSATQLGLLFSVPVLTGVLGGCTLPIAFGLAVDLLGIYSACFMVLYGLLATCMMVMFLALKADRFNQLVQQATMYNFLEHD